MEAAGGVSFTKSNSSVVCSISVSDTGETFIRPVCGIASTGAGLSAKVVPWGSERAMGRELPCVLLAAVSGVDPEGVSHWRHEFNEIPSFKTKPSFFIHFIFRLIQRKAKKELYQMGLGRLKQNDAYASGIEDIRSLSLILGTQPYFCGDKISLTDASVYAQIASLIYIPWQCPLKDSLLNDYTNLVDHTKRMGSTYFPELKPALTH